MQKAIEEEDSHREMISNYVLQVIRPRTGRVRLPLTRSLFEQEMSGWVHLFPNSRVTGTRPLVPLPLSEAAVSNSTLICGCQVTVI